MAKTALRVLVLLIVPSAGNAEQPRGPDERIAVLEANVDGIKRTLVRIENKIDEVDGIKETLEGIEEKIEEGHSEIEGALFSGDRLLEILIILIVGADKAAYWRKRRNGTWTKSAPIRATVSDNSHEESAIE